MSRNRKCLTYENSVMDQSRLSEKIEIVSKRGKKRMQ